MITWTVCTFQLSESKYHDVLVKWSVIRVCEMNTKTYTVHIDSTRRNCEFELVTWDD